MAARDQGDRILILYSFAGNRVQPFQELDMNAKMILAVAVIVVGCVGIGAWLVSIGHPWFGLLAMVIGGSCSYRSSDGDLT